MTWRFVRAALGAAALSSLGTPAAAALSFVYHQAASNPAGLPIAIEMSFAGPDAGMAGDASGGGFAGLLSFRFAAGGASVALQDLLDLQQRCAPPGLDPGCLFVSLAYELAPDRGYLRYNNTSFDFAFAYADGLLSGHFNTDFPGPAACRLTGVCRYDGAWLVVPEPLTAGLLAAGLAGLAAAARGRRRAAPA